MMASQFQVSHFEDYRHIGSRKWKESFGNSLFFSTFWKSLPLTNCKSQIETLSFTTSDNVKIDFTKTYLGAIVPTESRNPFEEIEENKEGSQAIFENWQILVGLRSHTVWGGLRLLQKNCLLNFTWQRQNEFWRWDKFQTCKQYIFWRIWCIQASLKLVCITSLNCC